MLDHNMDLHLAALDRQRLEGEVVRLCVENERLRAALESIHQGAATRCLEPRNYKGDEEVLAFIARDAWAALAGKEQG